MLLNDWREQVADLADDHSASVEWEYDNCSLVFRLKTFLSVRTSRYEWAGRGRSMNLADHEIEYADIYGRLAILIREMLSEPLPNKRYRSRRND